MAIDMSKVKAMLAKVNSKGGNPLVFKPAAGDNKIRIVPLEANPENPFQVLLFHYLGNKTYLSPLTYGSPDPIAEFKDALFSEGRLSKEEFIKAMQFAPSPRTYLPVVERGKEKDGVKYWAFGQKTLDELTAIFENTEYGDISDIQTGCDITINFTPADKAKKSFAKTLLVVSRKSTPLHEDPAVVKALTTNQPDLVSSFDKWTYAQLTEIRDRYVETMAASSPETSEPEESAAADETPAPVKSEEPVSVEATKTSEEFDALFNS